MAFPGCASTLIEHPMRLLCNDAERRVCVGNAKAMTQGLNGQRMAKLRAGTVVLVAIRYVRSIGDAPKTKKPRQKDAVPRQAPVVSRAKQIRNAPKFQVRKRAMEGFAAAAQTVSL